MRIVWLKKVYCKDFGKSFFGLDKLRGRFSVKSEFYSVKIVDNNIIIDTVIVLEGFTCGGIL